MAPMSHFPSGTVTFLFTDVEGSTKLLHELGLDGYAAALMEHRRILRAAFGARGGVEVDTQGDAFFVAFPTAAGALAAAAAARGEMTAGPIRVRMGIHSGTPHLAAEGYIGDDVHLAARIAAAGHGGQVLVSAATVALIGSNGLRDLGEHRLKDFADPVSIYQLGDDRFPPLRTISNTNLPRPASSFVGRETEVAEVAFLLRDGVRLLTLTGPGGTGKTRLAIEAAAALVPEFKAGVFWVGLAPLRDPALVIGTIAQTVGAKDGLADHIGQRDLMVLLDNLEQVIDAAPELAALVEACPNLRLLVTSRELLRVQGEVEFPVLPLADRDAVELFSARARTEPDDAVRQLCRALDNLPLALELAAARASVLTPAQILERLSERLDLLRGRRDADPRQQTLRATIAWSFELLTPNEQCLFARLAVFAGGWTHEAAEQVAQAELDTLQSLVDKNLVRHIDERFWMLETIREYATAQFEASGEAEELRRRHADHFLALAKEAEPHLRKQSKEWLDRIEREHDNIRAALDGFETAGENERVLELGAAVFEFWTLRGHFGEGRRRLESALAGDQRPTAARATALMGAADLALDTGDPVTTRLRAEEALALQRSLGDVWGTAHSTMLLGSAFAAAKDWASAQQRFDESARLFREVGDEHNARQATRRLAWTCAVLGDRERARALREDNLRWARESGDEHIEAVSLDVLAIDALKQGHIDDGVAMLTEAHGIYRDKPDTPDRFWDAMLLCRFARALALKGRARTAVQLLSCFESTVEDLGLSLEDPRREGDTAKTLTIIRKHLDAAGIAEGWERGRALTVDAAVTLALDSLA